MTATNRADAATVRIFASTFEQSPFAQFYDDADTVYGVYAERLYPVQAREDPVALYWALRRKAVLFDVPERPLEISGADAGTFLDRLFSRPISTLSVDRGRYGVAVTPRGGCFCDAVVFRRGAERFWIVHPDVAMDDWIAAHRTDERIEVSDPKARVIQVQGPASLRILGRLAPGAAALKYFHATVATLAGTEMYVSRTGWTGELGFEVYVPPEADPAAVWDALRDAGAPDGMETGSLAAMGIRRIEAGILDAGRDFDRDTTPFAAGLGSLVSFDDRAFIGRAALEHAARGRRLFGFTTEGDVPPFGTAVLESDAPAGHVTCAALSPYLGRTIGFVLMDADGHGNGETLDARWSGGAATLTLCDVPFYDPDKDIPRGKVVAEV